MMRLLPNGVKVARLPLEEKIGVRIPVRQQFCYNQHMTEKEIFEKLFLISTLSNDDNGVVTSCLVCNGRIIESAVSMNNGTHAEDALLEKLKQINFVIEPNDIVYTTVEPCGKRSPGGKGESMGDCTTNLIRASVKNIVYAASDPDASSETRYKFGDKGVIIKQVIEQNIIKKAIEIFNSTCSNRKNWLPYI